ncbi:phage tail tube protein [Thalassovita sp.]|uniref:phage tail tube protein n=1 Tax=Thalassovita sp. TaxID=1979401 RepID=UPI0029DE6FC8|nr:phage tail tube protein [Thalassovita sp.]
MARAQGARAQMALAFESTYGTSPVGGYTKMPFATASLGAEQPLQASELLGYGRDPLAPMRDAITADGSIVVPVDTEAFGVWLKGAFGDPVTTGTGPYTHVFTSGSWALPSFTVETGLPDVPSYALYGGCMVDKISWQMARSGLLTASVEIVAQGETLGTASGAGTPATVDLQRFGHFNGSVTRNGTAIGNIVGAELSYSNTLDRVETIRADGKIEGADPSIAAMTGRIDVRFADTVLLSQAISGTSCALEFAYSLASGEALTVSVPRVFLPRPRREITGPQGVQVSFDWQAAQQTNGDPMVTVTLINGREAY